MGILSNTFTMATTFVAAAAHNHTNTTTGDDMPSYELTNEQATGIAIVGGTLCVVACACICAYSCIKAACNSCEAKNKEVNESLLERKEEDVCIIDCINTFANTCFSLFSKNKNAEHHHHHHDEVHEMRMTN